MSSFPKRVKTSQTSERGVNHVSSIINDEFGWLFRRVPGESDFGIDGHADIVLEDGSVTGRSIALQIKTGSSFLKEQNEVGVVFRGEKKHLNYYINHQTPVIVVICDIENKVCYWEEFDLNRTDGTASGWTMTVPFSQKLDTTSKEALLAIAGPVGDITDAIQQQWAVNKLLKDMAHIHYAISRSDVESQDTSNIVAFFERLEKNVGVCKATQGKLSLSFSGYDEDARELWEIDEVRQWFSKAFSEIKYWFYFLDASFPGNTLGLILALLCDTTWEVRGSKASIDIEMMDRVMMWCFQWLNELTDRLGMPIEENQRISIDIITAMKKFSSE